MVGNQMRIEVGDFITLIKGATVVTGQCMGYKVDRDGLAVELWIDGFYGGFELGTEDREWRLQDA